MTDDTDDAGGAVVLVSGGMDSATAAYRAREAGHDLYLLHASYGQDTEDVEFDRARRQADRLGAAEFLHVETEHLARIGASSLTDDDVEIGDADLDSDEIPASYVPFRNANLLSMAVSYAEANDCTAVYIGAHSEDYSGYPDCRPAFFDAFQSVVDVGTRPETEIDLRAPFVDDAKREIVEAGHELGVPYEITWSCYRAETPACGTCDACAYRLKAFQQAGIEDPIEYERRPTYVD